MMALVRTLAASAAGSGAKRYGEHHRGLSNQFFGLFWDEVAWGGVVDNDDAWPKQGKTMAAFQ